MIRPAEETIRKGIETKKPKIRPIKISLSIRRMRCASKCSGSVTANNVFGSTIIIRMRESVTFTGRGSTLAPKKGASVMIGMMRPRIKKMAETAVEKGIPASLLL